MYVVKYAALGLCVVFQYVVDTIVFRATRPALATSAWREALTAIAWSVYFLLWTVDTVAENT